MRTEGLRGTLLSTLLIALLVVPATSLLSVSPSSAAPEGLTPRAPIYIDGNDNFTPANGVTSGSGTENDPYIIENWDISAGSANGIEIRNTTAHFVIRNCYVHDGWTAEMYGIYLDNVKNGEIDNNIAENNFSGIHLEYSDNNLIENNGTENNRYNGIRLDDSDNNVIYNNTCRNNGDDGIELLGSNNNSILNNFMENNLANGIVLSGSDNNLISGNTMENNSYGIYLSSSSNNAISGNTVDNNRYGISLDSSDNNAISGNTVDNNDYGIRLDYSSNNTLDNNTLSNNLYNFGVYGTFVQDIDTSNLVNGKPIRYLVNNKNEVIGPSLETGYLGLVNSDNIRVENLAIGNNGQGILLAFTENSWVENCTLENNYSGIYLSSSSNNNTISGNTVNNNDYGILLDWSSSNNTISGNTVDNNYYDGIRLWHSSNNAVSGNTVGNNYLGIILWSSPNNAISGNTVDNNYFGIYLDWSSSNNTISGNTVDNNNYGIYLWYSSNNAVSGNTVNNNQNSGIRLFDYSDNNLISNNVVKNNYSGVDLSGYSNNNLMLNNYVENNYFGIYLDGQSGNNTLENNLAKNNRYYGIAISGPNNFVSNNTVESSGDYGIYLISSDNNRIDNNLVENNNYGIGLEEYSNNNTVSNNIVENNSGGISISYNSDNNLIYHNNFVNNATQAYDECSNYWDNGYPAGGNYWSDYTGVDNYRSENQDIPGSDGIGDTPYYIPGDNNRDRYPLMEPWPPEVEKVWDALIAASFSGGSDDAIFGVRPDATSGFDIAYDIPEPHAPPEPPYIRAYFYYPGQTPDKLHRSFIAPEDLMEWPLRIEYADNVENITLSWNLENVPNDYTVLLFEDGSLVADMRAVDNYTFEATSGNFDFNISVAVAMWKLIETWTGTVEAPAGWQLIETWTGAIEAPAQWRPIETWTGTVRTLGWQLIESWTGTIEAPVYPSKPTLKSPADGTITNNNTPTFEWTVGKNATSHRLLVDNDANFLTPIENRVFGATENTYKPVVENSLPDDNYSWKVIAINALGENQSSVWTFMIDTVPPAAPSLISPVDGTITDDSTPTFDWSDVTGAENYDLLVDNNPDFSSPEIQVTVSVSTHTPTAGLPDGKYWWKVRARDAAGNVSNWSSIWTLTISVARGVDVYISPSYQSGLPGATLSYTVTVKNEGNISDTYALTATDNENWSPTLSKNSLALAPKTYDTVTLTVTIPTGASLGAQDNITVTAKSTVDPTVSDNARCTAQATAIRRRVEVSISPESKSGPPGGKLTYSVTVLNEGDVEDTYNLTVVDDLTWGATVSPTSLTIAAGRSGTATLSATIPAGTASGTEDEITVKATSRTVLTVSDSATCIASAAAVIGVKVSISPENQSGAPEETLTYTITVKNEGNAGETYILSVAGAPDWSPRVENNSLTLSAGGTSETTLTVTIPSGVSEGDSITVNVTTISVGDPRVVDSDTCLAIVKGVPAVPEELPIPLAISAFLIGAVILSTGSILHVRSTRAARRMVLRGPRRLKGF